MIQIHQLARVSLSIAIVIGAAAACSRSPVSNDSPVIAALRSCDGDTTSSRAPSRFQWSGAPHSFAKFTLFIPDSVRVGSVDGEGTVHLTWPRCSACRFDVAIHGDSGIDVEARVRRLVAEQRRIDSVNKDPAALHEFDDIDGPPRPITTAAGNGYLISESCGDCGSTTLLVGRPGTVAEIAFGGDDNVPELGRRECEMAVVAKSFAWRP